MQQDSGPAAIQALVNALNRGDRTALGEVFTEDVIFEWPQSGERIRGDSNRREIYSRFPSLPKVTPARTIGRGDLWVLEATVDDDDGDPYQCVLVFELRGERIAKEIAYWAKPFPAPEWRAPWVERM